MTAPDPSPAEAAIIDRFGIFAEERVVEEVARAIWDWTAMSYNDEERREIAVAAVAAYRAVDGGADEAVRLLDLLAEDTDDIPCRYDHHGACQEHGGGSEEPGACSDRDAHELLKRLGSRAALAPQANL